MSRLRRQRIGSSNSRHAGDLRERHGHAVARGWSGRQTAGVEPLLRTARATTATRSVPSRISVTVRPEISVCSVSATSCGASPERPGAVLVDHQPDRRRHLVPLEVRVADLRVPRHRFADLLGDPADLHRLVADHAELHREADRRPEVEAVDPHPRAGERASATAFSSRALMRSRASVSLEMITVSANAGFGSCGIEPEPEAHAALADIGRVCDDVRIAGSSSASAFSTTRVVAPIDEPSGRRIWRNSSGRSRVGKNCCCTLPKPTIARDEQRAGARR